MTVGLIDYKAGNRKSVENALNHLHVAFRVIERPEELVHVDKIIFPGVGEARAAMEVLAERGLDQGLRGAAASGVPLLGICIGCQLFLDRSEERDAECLGIVGGTSRRFPSSIGLKIPQIGWNQLFHLGRHRLFEGIPDGGSFYFDHSYYPDPADRALTIGETEYGLPFVSAYARDNVLAVQFHPEKSGPYGLRLLSNFAEMRD